MIYDLNQSINATEFPLPCHFALADSSNASNTFVGGSYMMVSTKGRAVTRSLDTSSTSQVQTTMIPSTLSTNIVSPSSSSAVATSQPSPQPTRNHHKVTGISSGLLAAAIVLAILGSATLIFLGYWIWNKRKVKKQMISGSADMHTRHESDGDMIYEAESRHNAPELCGPRVPVLVSQGRHELHGETMEKTGPTVSITTQSG